MVGISFHCYIFCDFNAIFLSLPLGEDEPWPTLADRWFLVSQLASLFRLFSQTNHWMNSLHYVHKICCTLNTLFVSKSFQFEQITDTIFTFLLFEFWFTYILADKKFSVFIQNACNMILNVSKIHMHKLFNYKDFAWNNSSERQFCFLTDCTLHNSVRTPAICMATTSSEECG